MSFAVSSNGKEFEVDLWIGITIHDVVSAKDILGLRRKKLIHIDSIENMLSVSFE